jgi:hypothetical protein
VLLQVYQADDDFADLLDTLRRLHVRFSRESSGGADRGAGPHSSIVFLCNLAARRAVSASQLSQLLALLRRSDPALTLLLQSSDDAATPAKLLELLAK